MMKTNDDKILLLKKQVDDKKLELSKKKKGYANKTNLILTWRNCTYNLNVLSYNELLALDWEISSFDRYLIDVHNIFEFEVSGYKLIEWHEDIMNKIEMIRIKNEEAQLKKMESKLDKLLSEDKKTELELNDIAALLGV